MLNRFKSKVKSNPRTIVFPEGDDPRIIDAAIRLYSEGLIRRARLLGPAGAVEHAIQEAGYRGDGLQPVDTAALSKNTTYRMEYARARNLSDLENEIIETAMSDPVVLGALLLRRGDADGFIGGIRTTTARILSAGLNIIKADRRVGVVTSFCLVDTGIPTLGEDGLIIIADTVVNPDPSVGVLCKIAEAVAYFTRHFLSMEPRIAFLSYSTKGSGIGKTVDKMRIAAERSRHRLAGVLVDGEYQLDAALSPEVASRKAPGGLIKGNANVLIFPNLDSANIATKILHFSQRASVVGPVIYGLNRPYNDISRAATAEDVYHLALVTQLQS